MLIISHPDFVADHSHAYEFCDSARATYEEEQRKLGEPDSSKLVASFAVNKNVVEVTMQSEDQALRERYAAALMFSISWVVFQGLATDSTLLCYSFEVRRSAVVAQ